MSQALFTTSPFELEDLLGEPRKAALLLHSMRPRDQRWILDRLDAGHRTVLADLLIELKELGIPAEPSLLDELMSRPRSQTSQLPPSGDKDHQALEQAEPAQIIQVLGNEPAGLIAQVLELHDWPWSRDVLEGLESSKRREVESRRSSLRRSISASPKDSGLRQHLLANLSRRLPINSAPAKREGLIPSGRAFAVLGTVRSLWHRVTDSVPKAAR